MIGKTIDNQKLVIGNEYTLVSFEFDANGEDEHISSLDKCTYLGNSTRDNSNFLDSLPPDCSGLVPPRIETMYNFSINGEPHKEIILNNTDVRYTILADASLIQEVTITKKVIKCQD